MVITPISIILTKTRYSHVRREKTDEANNIADRRIYITSKDLKVQR